MRRIKKAALAALLVLAAITTAALVTWFAATEDDKEEMIDAITDTYAQEGETERVIDWASLPDSVVAWVEVPGTNIDEPIVQASREAPNAYLHKDALGQGNYGTPYIDCDCSLESPFVMVYGHHMSDGSVFADFAKFIDEDYAREHEEIIVYKRDGETLGLEVRAVDVVNASCERLVVNQEADFGKLIASADLMLSNPANDGQLYAFTTCSYQTWNSRTVVYALKA